MHQGGAEALSRRRIDLGGAVVVITGASSGIGRATAVDLAARGARLVLVARSDDDLQEVADRCREAGGEAVPVPADVADPGAAAHVVEVGRRTFGRIDAWVNNAAVMAYGRFDEVPVEVHRRVVETNLLGPMHAAAAVLPVFREQGKGALVNVSSLYGEITTPLVAAYATSKFGLIGFSRVLRRELRRDRGIRVATVLPASVDTPIFRHAANFTGRQPRPVPPVLKTARVVRVIRRAVERGDGEQLVGGAGRAFRVGQRLLPPLYDRLVNPVMRVGGLGLRRADDGTGNVFSPMPEWNRRSGRWRHPWRRAAVAGVAAAAGAAVAVARADGS